MPPTIFITQPVFEPVVQSLAEHCTVTRNTEDRPPSRQEMYSALAALKTKKILPTPHRARLRNAVRLRDSLSYLELGV